MNDSERISAAIPADLLSLLVDRAREADRSVSAEVRVAIREHVASEPANGQRAQGARKSSSGAGYTRARATNGKHEPKAKEPR